MKTDARKYLHAGSLLVLTVALVATALLAAGCHSPRHGHYSYPAYHGYGGCR